MATPTQFKPEFDLEALREKFQRPDLYQLIKISDDDLKSDDRFNMAKCSGTRCSNPVVYYWISITWAGSDALETEFFCEDHKPD